MADPELSSGLRELGDKVLAALNIVKMPIASYKWNYVPSLNQYQLVIQTPWYHEKGPDTTRRALADALQKAGITEPTGFVVLKRPETKTAQANGLASIQ